MRQYDARVGGSGQIVTAVYTSHQGWVSQVILISDWLIMFILISDWLIMIILISNWLILLILISDWLVRFNGVASLNTCLSPPVTTVWSRCGMQDPSEHLSMIYQVQTFYIELNFE